MSDAAEKKPTRIQTRNRRKILEAALDVFSQEGFGGATIDQIAARAGLSKPNLLYYFPSKEAIHVALLNELMDTWLDPLLAMDPEGEALDEILAYVERKLEMARDLPRESRLFANEILQGAPRMAPHLEADLKPLFDAKCRMIDGWVMAGKLARIDPRHLIFSIWANTQHYADFDAQIRTLLHQPDFDGARRFLVTLYTKLLTPEADPPR